MSDLLFLRRQDLKTTDNGVLALEMVDRPLDAWPRRLKGGPSDERLTPLHPVLVERGAHQLFE